MCIQAIHANAGEVVGKIVVANGGVRIVSGEGTSLKKRMAKTGESITNEDTIETAARSSAKLLFTDQSVVDLSANTAFKVSDYDLKNGENRSGTFALLYGKIRSVVNKKVGNSGNVQYKAGGTVMGVRGTEFIADVTGGKTANLLVVEGAISVVTPSGQTGFVRGGEMISAPVGTSPANSLGGGSPVSGGDSSSGGLSVTKVSQQEMGNMVSDMQTADNTFNFAVSMEPQQQDQQASQETGGGFNEFGGGEKAPAPGEGGPSMAMEFVGNLVSEDLDAHVDGMNVGDINRSMPEFIDAGDSFLPPVNLPPGAPTYIRIILAP